MTAAMGAGKECEMESGMKAEITLKIKAHFKTGTAAGMEHGYG